MGLRLFDIIKFNSVGMGTVLVCHGRRSTPLERIDIGLGLGQRSDKKWGPPSPRAGVGQENIATVHEPKPTQTASSP